MFTSEASPQTFLKTAHFWIIVLFSPSMLESESSPDGVIGDDVHSVSDEVVGEV